MPIRYSECIWLNSNGATDIGMPHVKSHRSNFSFLEPILKKFHVCFICIRYNSLSQATPLVYMPNVSSLAYHECFGCFPCIIRVYFVYHLPLVLSMLLLLINYVYKVFHTYIFLHHARQRCSHRHFLFFIDEFALIFGMRAATWYIFVWGIDVLQAKHENMLTFCCWSQLSSPCYNKDGFVRLPFGWWFRVRFRWLSFIFQNFTKYFNNLDYPVHGPWTLGKMKNHSPVYTLALKVMKAFVSWPGLSLLQLPGQNRWDVIICML